jgi:hypothetical protein
MHLVGTSTLLILLRLGTGYHHPMRVGYRSHRRRLMTQSKKCSTLSQNISTNTRIFGMKTTTKTIFSTKLSTIMIFSMMMLPLAVELHPWPPSYKPPQLPMYDGHSDPKQFLMSYEATISSYGGNTSVMAKSFVMAVKNVTQTLYYSLHPGTMTS